VTKTTTKIQQIFVYWTKTYGNQNLHLVCRADKYDIFSLFGDFSLYVLTGVIWQQR